MLGNRLQIHIFPFELLIDWWLFVAGYWLLIIGCWLFVSCCLLVVGYWLLGIDCWLLIVVIGCLLLVIGCWLFVIRCWLLGSTMAYHGAFKEYTEGRWNLKKLCWKKRSQIQAVYKGMNRGWTNMPKQAKSRKRLPKATQSAPKGYQIDAKTRQHLPKWWIRADVRLFAQFWTDLGNHFVTIFGNTSCEMLDKSSGNQCWKSINYL